MNKPNQFLFKPSFFIISDTHWGDKNLLKHVDRPKHHEEMMIARWHRTVKPNDIILHLGDLISPRDEYYLYFKDEIVPQLTGKKYIILGNHDRRKRDYWNDLGFKIIKPFDMQYRGYTVSFDHYPKLLNQKDNPKHFHIHGHIHNHGYSRNESVRWGNINVSIEVMDYRPKRISRVLNKAISNCNKLNKQQVNLKKRAS